jgi:hypothetical protein
MAIEAIARSVLLMEVKFQHRSPWRTVYSMQAVVRKASTAKAIEWCFLMVADRCLSGELSPEKITTDWLVGSHGKASAVGVFTFKMEIREFLLKKKGPELKLRDEVVSEIRDKMHSVAKYRTHLKPLDATEGVCLAWKKGWRASENLWLQFVEEALYGVKLDGSIKTASTSKTPEEWLAYAAVKEKLVEVEEAMTKEKAEEGATGGDDKKDEDAEDRLPMRLLVCATI